MKLCLVESILHIFGGGVGTSAIDGGTSAIDGGASAPKQQTELFLHWNISPKLRNRCVGGGVCGAASVIDGGASVVDKAQVRLTVVQVQSAVPRTRAVPHHTTLMQIPLCVLEREEGGRERHVITQIWCLQADKIWYAIQTPYLTQLAKHSHLYWLFFWVCLCLGQSTPNLWSLVTGLDTPTPKLDSLVSIKGWA